MSKKTYDKPWVTFYTSKADVIVMSGSGIGYGDSGDIDWIANDQLIAGN